MFDLVLQTGERRRPGVCAQRSIAIATGWCWVRTSISRESQSLSSGRAQQLISRAEHDGRSRRLRGFFPRLPRRTRFDRFVIYCPIASSPICRRIRASRSVPRSRRARWKSWVAATRVPRDLEAQLIRFSSLDAYQPRPLWEIFDPAILALRTTWRRRFLQGQGRDDRLVRPDAARRRRHAD